MLVDLFLFILLRISIPYPSKDQVDDWLTILARNDRFLLVLTLAIDEIKLFSARYSSAVIDLVLNGLRKWLFVLFVMLRSPGSCILWSSVWYSWKALGFKAF